MPLTSLKDWESYIPRLAGDALRSKTLAANTQTFADSLRSSGGSMDDFKRVLLLFVRQFVRTGQKIPEGGIYDLPSLGRQDPVCRQMTALDVVAVERLSAQPPAEEDGISVEIERMSY
jgi:hypothetical protein